MGPGGPTGLQNRVAWRNVARMVRLHPFSAILTLLRRTPPHLVPLRLRSGQALLQGEKGPLAERTENSSRVAELRLPVVWGRVPRRRKSRANRGGRRRRVSGREWAARRRENARRFFPPAAAGDGSEWRGWGAPLRAKPRCRSAPRRPQP